jgi:hypothetical protein
MNALPNAVYHCLTSSEAVPWLFGAQCLLVEGLEQCPEVFLDGLTHEVLTQRLLLLACYRTMILSEGHHAEKLIPWLQFAERLLNCKHKGSV